MHASSPTFIHTHVLRFLYTQYIHIYIRSHNTYIYIYQVTDDFGNVIIDPNACLVASIHTFDADLLIAPAPTRDICIDFEFDFTNDGGTSQLTKAVLGKSFVCMYVYVHICMYGVCSLGRQFRVNYVCVV